MSTHDASALYGDIAQAIDGEDIVSLSRIIETQSELRERDDVLADALFISCERGCHQIAHHLLAQEGAKPDLPSKSKQSKNYPPLIVAVQFLQKDFDSATSKNGRSDEPRHPVAQQIDLPSLNRSERTQSIVSLLQHGASLTARGPDGKNVLFHITSGDIAELLLAARIGPELQEALSLKDHSGYDALMSAIVRKCDTTVSLSLITHGADIRTVDTHHRTTLMNASWRGRVDVVERLLQDKIVVAMKDKRGRNIWHHVAQDYEHVWEPELIKILFTIDENDASVNDTGEQERTSLHVSCIFGTLAIAKALLESGRAYVHKSEPNENKTPLHYAAAYGHSAVVQLLIKHNADRNATCNGNLLPLHLACGSRFDSVDTVRVLLADQTTMQLNARTEDNMTPLHVAAAHGHINIVKALLETQGFANVDAQCQGGWTALHLACGRQLTDNPLTGPRRSDVQEKSHVAVVQALLSAGSEVNKKSQTSRTALHIAAELGHVEIVKVLLAQKDVQFAAKDSSGNTPLLDAAKSERRNKILPLFAPWTTQSIEALPQDIKKSARDFDANIIDFQKAANTNQPVKPRRHKIPVFDLLYKPSSTPGAISRTHVSTRPDPNNQGGFRWIHLPANNLHWCHTLLTKHFTEGGFADVNGFKDMERSLSQHQYRGRKIHSQFMRPTCLAPSRQPEAQDHGYTNASCGEYDGLLNSFARVSSFEVVEPERAPPDPIEYNSPKDQDLSGFQHPELDLQESGGILGRLSAQFRSRSKTSAAIGQASEDSGRGDPCGSDLRTELHKGSDSTRNDSLRSFLFMPYFALESRTSVGAMHKRFSPKPSDAAGKSVEQSDRQVTASPSEDRDARLLQAYSDWKANDYGLHIRRTLDQFFYRNVDTRQRDDDQVVLRYQRNNNSIESDETFDAHSDEELEQNLDVLMVDQLWVWVLGPELIVTSFPQKWQQPRKELPDLLSSVLEKLDPRTGDPVQSIYGLAACIVGQCMSTCDRAMYQSHKASVLDMFSESVGDVMNEEVKLFSRFEEDSVKASRWMKSDLLNNSVQESKKRQDFGTTYDEALRSVSSKDAKTEGSRGPTNEPSFVEHLLDIRYETKLLKEVKDIQDELNILLEVTQDQQLVHKEILGTFGPTLRPESNSSDRQNIEDTLKDQHLSLHQQEIEIRSMEKQVKSVYKSITDLLDHKQKHANAIEARYARKQADDTAKAGLTLMVFTTVTVIFLPLSFLAAFFAINIKELPHDEDKNEQQMPLAFIMRNVVGVGLGTALAFVLMAWYHHRIVPWALYAGRWLIQKFRLLVQRMHKLSQSMATWSSREGRVDQAKGIENSILVMSLVADSVLEHRARKDRAHHDEEKAMNGSL